MICLAFSETIPEKQAPPPVWLDLSIGFMGSFTNGYDVFYVTSALWTKQYDILLGTEYRFGDSWFSGCESVKEYNLLIGKCIENSFFRFTLAGGAGLMHFSNYSDGYYYDCRYNDCYHESFIENHIEKLEMGIPVDLSIQFIGLKYFGIGASFRANFNPVSSMAGLTFNCLLGKLRI
jgi:hypothetical protein